MTGFTSIAYSTPWLVLLAGALTIAGLLGAGSAIGRRLRLQQPWRTVVGCVAALEIYTLIVEILAMTHVATPSVLIAAWLAMSLFGVLRLAAAFQSAGRPPRSTWWILALNLAVALAPSTKSDEVYYHMIVPSRIVRDHGLRFYREPLRAAIEPQMAFQMGFAPFHALRVPDAGNVVSWFFGALLIWFTYSIVRAKTGSARWAAVFSSAIVAGTYTTIWHTSSGAHAVGDLAVTAAVVALYTMDDLKPSAGWSIGILAAAAASTKVLLFPFAGVVVMLAAIRLRRVVPLVVPGLVFMAPLMIWTAVHAGSPLGPLMEGSTGPSPYPPGEVRAFVDDYVAGPRGPIPQKLRNEAVNYSPILWLSIVGLLALRRRVSIKPGVAFALLMLQLVVILGWNTYDARYFGGVHYALMILFAIFLEAALRERLVADRRFVLVVVVLIVPWMLLQFVYAMPFLKVLVHAQSKTGFLRAYVPLYDDFVALDRKLPRDATILSMPYGLASIYAPRRLEYHPLDVRSDGPLYRLTYFQDGEQESPQHGAEVYRNDHAIVSAFRLFGRKPLRARLRVWRLR